MISAHRALHGVFCCENIPRCLSGFVFGILKETFSYKYIKTYGGIFMINTEKGAGCALKFDTSFGHEGGGDFSLPEYLPEIQRILAVKTVVLPETKFLSGNVLEIGGTLSYDITYANTDGGISSASLITDYTADTALPCGVENVGELFVITEEESSSCRVTSPRGVGIKTRLKTRICADETVITDAALIRKDGRRIEGAEALSIERCSFPALSVVRGHVFSTGNVSGELTAKENGRIISCRAVVFVSEALASEDSVKIFGDIVLTCVFDEDGCSNKKCAKYPFEISIPVDTGGIQCKARAWGKAASVSVTPTESQGTFSVSIEYDIEAEYMSDANINICSDVYSTEYECSGEMRECELISPAFFGMGKVSLSAFSEVTGEGIGEVYDVVPLNCSVQLSTDGEKTEISGYIKAKAILSGNEFTSSEIDIPIKYSFDKACGADIQSFISCSVLDLSGNIMSGRLEVSGEAFLSWDISSKKKICYVTLAELGDEFSNDGENSVKVYYPHEDESLWNICKKYKADTELIKRTNPDIGEYVPKGTPIIII